MTSPTSPTSPSPRQPSVLVDLNVSGENVTVLRDVLTRVPGSRLAAWVTGAEPAPHDAQGRLFIDRDPASFRRLAQYRPGQLPPMNQVEVERFKADAAYLGLGAEIDNDLALAALRAELARSHGKNRPLRYALAERLEAAGDAVAGFDLFSETAQEEGGYNNEAVERYMGEDSEPTARSMRRAVFADRVNRGRVAEHYRFSAEALRLEPTHFESLLVRGMLLCHQGNPAYFPGDDGALLAAIQQSTAEASADQAAALAPLFAILQQHATLRSGLHAAARGLGPQTLAAATQALLALNPPEAPCEDDRGDRSYDPRLGPTHRIARRVARWCLKVGESREGLQLMRQAYATCPESVAVRTALVCALVKHQYSQDALESSDEILGASGSTSLREALSVLDRGPLRPDAWNILGGVVSALATGDCEATEEVTSLLRETVPKVRTGLSTQDMPPELADALTQLEKSTGQKAST